MANPESKKLAVDVIARIDKLEKGMAKAAAATKTGSAQMERATDRARGRVEANFASMGKSAASMAKSFAAPLLALGAAGVVRAVGDVARGIAEVADEAKRAGVSIEAFQELKHVAEQNRIGVDALTDGLKELNLRADEFITTGAGSAAEAFQRIGYSAAELKEKLKDPSALFTEIIGKLGQLDRAAQIRIADEIFGGTGGEKFVQLIEQGEAGIKATIEQARTLGLVMSQEVVDKAIELDQKFNLVASTVGTALKGAIVEAATALGNFIDSFQEFENRSSSNLEDRLNFLKSGGGGMATGKGGTAAVEAASKKRLEEIAEIEAILRERAMGQLRTGLAALPSQGGTPSLPSSGLPVVKKDSAAAAAKVAEAEAVLKHIDALKFEREAIGMSARELAVANAVRGAGTAATAEQVAEIQQLAGANYDAAVAQDALNESMAAMQQLAGDTIRSFVDDIRKGVPAVEALGNAFDALADKLLDMAIDAAIMGFLNMLMPGAGSAAGGIGSLFGFAKGGIASHGRPRPLPTFAKGGVSNSAAIFGEAGPEAAVPLPDGRRIPVDLSMPSMPKAGGGAGAPGAGGSIQVSVQVGVQDGNLVPLITRVSGEVAGQKIEQRTPQIVKQVAPGAVKIASGNRLI